MVWEYKTVFVQPEQFDNLTTEGQDGWEAFAASPIGGISNLWVIWLKREEYNDTLEPKLVEMITFPEAEGNLRLEQENELQTNRRGRKPKGR